MSEPLHIVTKARWVPRDEDRMNPSRPAKAKPCPTCICRTANLDAKCDRPDWNQYYRRSTLEAAWEGTYDPDNESSAFGAGGLNHCHLTHDHACAGTQVAQERELIRFHARVQRGIAIDAALGRLTFNGVKRIAARMFGREVPLYLLTQLKRQQLLDAAHPAIADPAIGHPSVDPPKPGEFDAA